MKVAFITPFYQQSTRGNAVTVRRLERHLSAAGCDVRVFSLEEFSGIDLLQEVRAFAPACIHAFHGCLGGPPARQIALSLGIPYLITLTGTDVYGESVPDRIEELTTVLLNAAALAVFHDVIRQRLLSLLPELIDKIVVIPQGVDLPEVTGNEEVKGEFVFLLPAGIRPVKNVLFPLRPLLELHASYPQLRFELAGPVIDEVYGHEVMTAIAGYPFARWLGEVPFEKMPERYAAASVVLNTSLSEGGMANSLLEAMAAGRPVLVNDIEGNRSLVDDGVNGLLYNTEADFREKAALLLADSALRQRLGSAGQRYVVENCSSQGEAERYHRLYRRLADKR